MYHTAGRTLAEKDMPSGRSIPELVRWGYGSSPTPGYADGGWKRPSSPPYFQTPGHSERSPCPPGWMFDRPPPGRLPQLRLARARVRTGHDGGRNKPRGRGQIRVLRLGGNLEARGVKRGGCYSLTAPFWVSTVLG